MQVVILSNRLTDTIDAIYPSEVAPLILAYDESLNLPIEEGSERDDKILAIYREVYDLKPYHSAYNTANSGLANDEETLLNNLRIRHLRNLGYEPFTRFNFSGT